MNVFYLDKNPKLAAEFHCDKHVVKMLIEYAQLMSTAHRVMDGEEWYDRTANNRRIKRWKHPDSEMDKILYLASHVNHPSGIWLRKSTKHYDWLYEMWLHLHDEFVSRYNKKHLSNTKLTEILCKYPDNMPTLPWEDPPPAMPDHCKIHNDSLASYRKYYITEKVRFATWKTETPIWFKEKNADLCFQM
tara:strand:+ start:2337 stop:2903 length:567 start_codon:yes stop_codon:yes gene_type:complete